MKNPKKIVYVTGSRAEYGVMKSLLGKIDKNPSFELSLIVTGAHLIKDFGFSIQMIKKDGFKIGAVVDTKFNDNTNAGMAKSLGQAIIGITEALEKIKPHLVLIAGDRGEMLAAAIGALHLNIIVAHISGGDITTGAVIDEHIRHAITKLANIHFPANEKSAKHIIKMGENSEYVFPMGNPGIPLTYHLSDKRKKKIARKYNLNVNQPILLVIQHPITTQVGLSAFQIRETMEAVKELKMQAIVIYPNSDAGSRDIIKIIHEYKDLDFIRIYKNIEREDFIDLMALGSVIIGNSSCALIEAPSFNLPAVNIGMRQEGRERAENIIDVSYNKKEIKKAILKAIYDKKFKAKVKRSLNPYVKKGTEENIIKILKKIILSDFPKRKFLGN